MLYSGDMENTSHFVSNLTQVLSLGAIIGIIVVFAWAILLLVSLHQKKNFFFFKTVTRYVLPLGFLVSFSGMVLSLLYSEVFHFIPCELCWYQRVFIYSQAFIFGYAWYRKDTSILPYSLLLSGVGFIIAMYHHALQVGYDIYKPCSTSPFAVDCAKPSFVEFGFVTFPFMAVVLFSFLIALSLTVFVSNKRGE